MNRNQRARIDLREQARQRVRVATRWVALASGGLAAAFAVALTHNSVVAAPASTDAPATTPQGSTAPTTGPSSVLPLRPPIQPPANGFGGGFTNFGSSGGS